MKLTTLSRVCFVLALCLGVAALGSWTAAGRQALTVDAESKDFGVRLPGTKFTLPFVLHNHTSSPINIIGCENEGCSPQGCLEAPARMIVLPSGGQLGLPLEVATREEGKYERHVRLFTDYPGRPIVVLNVRGMVSGAAAR